MSLLTRLISRFANQSANLQRTSRRSRNLPISNARRPFCSEPAETPKVVPESTTPTVDWINGTGTKPLLVLNILPSKMVPFPLNQYLPPNQVDPSERITFIPPAGFLEDRKVDPKRSANQIFVSKHRYINSVFWSKKVHRFNNLEEFLVMRTSKFFYQHPKGKVTTVTDYPEEAVEHLKDIPFSLRIYDIPILQWGTKVGESTVPSLVVETPEGVWENTYNSLDDSFYQQRKSGNHFHLTQLLQCIRVNDKKPSEAASSGEQHTQEEAKATEALTPFDDKSKALMIVDKDPEQTKTQEGESEN